HFHVIVARYHRAHVKQDRARGEVLHLGHGGSHRAGGRERASVVAEFTGLPVHEDGARAVPPVPGVEDEDPESSSFLWFLLLHGAFAPQGRGLMMTFRNEADPPLTNKPSGRWAETAGRTRGMKTVSCGWSHLYLARRSPSLRCNSSQS